ncbi:hypothetical protein [Aphanothece hegewaldii]|uniref:hypothetical protein n=1 Tax=Aphanothece hegewaldii TaxID=1521625 RepID=UPI0015E75419|nr:hypothetical protein [Aphanothece hegewaldii]
MPRSPNEQVMRAIAALSTEETYAYFTAQGSRYYLIKYVGIIKHCVLLLQMWEQYR